MASRYSMVFCGNSTSDAPNADWPNVVENIRQLINQRAKEKGSVQVICGTTPGTELASAWAAVKAKQDGSDVKLTMAHMDNEEYKRLGQDETKQFATAITKRLLTEPKGKKEKYVDAHVFMNNEQTHQNMMLRISGAYATPQKPGVNETVLVITNPQPSIDHPAMQIYEAAQSAINKTTKLVCESPEKQKQNTDEQKTVTQNEPVAKPTTENNENPTDTINETQTEQETMQEEPQQTDIEPKETEIKDVTIDIDSDELAYRNEFPELYQDDYYDTPESENDIDLELPKNPVILVAKEGQWLATQAGKKVELGSIDPEFPYELDTQLTKPLDKNMANIIQAMIQQDLAKFESTNEPGKLHAVLNPEIIEGHLKAAGFDRKLGNPMRPEATKIPKTELTAADVIVPGAQSVSEKKSQATQENDHIEQP